MQFGALGDIHGDFETVHAIMRRHAGIPFWVCVGDLADEHGRYVPVEAPLYWIKGNNENFDAIVSGTLPANLHYVPNGRRLELQGLVLAGLGGTFAPTWYDSPAAELPFPGMPRATRGDGPGSLGPQERAGLRRASATRRAAGVPIRDDKRRHFVREEVDACKALRGVDLFLTHEAPRPFVVGGRGGGRGIDAGKTPVNEILAAARPRLHLFGHHHRFSDGWRHGVRSIGLDLVSGSYLLVETEAMRVTRVTTGGDARPLPAEPDGR